MLTINMNKNTNPYTKDVSHLDKIDIYRICDLYDVKDDPISHAIKKLLCAGVRGYKGRIQDYKEARDSIDRCLEMIEEDKGKIGGMT